MWHHLLNGSPAGPVDESRMARMIANGEIGRESMVWREGMAQWQRADQTPLRDLFAAPSTGSLTPPPPPPAAGSGAGVVGVAVPGWWAPESFRSLWTWMAYLVGGGAVLSLVLIGIPALLAGFVIYYILLYRFWSLLQGHGARTTAGQAVGFMFIPFFNFYWAYVAVVGLCEDTNAFIARSGVQAPLVSRELAMAHFILSIVCVIPYLNLLAIIPFLVISILLWKQLCTTAAGIAASRAAARPS